MLTWNQILQVLLVPLVGWCFWVTMQLRANRRDHTKLVYMHEHPEKTGFGTVGIVPALNELARTNREMIYYQRWLAEAITGKKAPPFVDAEGS